MFKICKYLRLSQICFAIMKTYKENGEIFWESTMKMYDSIIHYWNNRAGSWIFIIFFQSYGSKSL